MYKLTPSSLSDSYVLFQQTILCPQTYCHSSLPQPLMHAFNKTLKMNIPTSTPKATTAKTYVKEGNLCLKYGLGQGVYTFAEKRSGIG